MVIIPSDFDPIQRASKAETLFTDGYNCCQAVVMAFDDLFDGITVQHLSQIALGFGGGMGRMRQVCGAFSASVMLSGLISPVFNPKDIAARTTNYSLVQTFAEKFKEANGPSIICGELLGLKPYSSPIPSERTADYYHKRPCSKIVFNTALYIANYLNNLLDFDK